VLLVVPEASLASRGPPHLRVEAERTQRVAGLAVGGAGAGGVDGHAGAGVSCAAASASA
jgi:hypothetical protein